MSVNRTRNKTVTFRMTEEEQKQFLKLLRDKIKKTGAKNQTDFLLRILKDKEINVIDALVPMLKELKRQGINLNQIARRLNQGDISKLQVIEDTLNECRVIYEKLLELVE